MSSSPRWLSVDVLRGLTIIAMLVVNNPGSWAQIYAPLRHAEWHGLTPTDLVFPFFLFLVGVSITLSQRLQSPGPTPVAGIVWRSGKLFAIGLVLALFYYQPLSDAYSWWQDTLLSVRWLGVLQRIALVYLVCALLAGWCQGRRGNWQLLIIALLLLLAYSVLLLAVPYPLPDGSMAQGVLAPGNNLPAFVDHHVLGIDHVWHRDTLPFASDPEGLLSTLPAITTGLGGVLAGRWLQCEPSKRIALSSLFLMLVGTALLALVLNRLLPVNKTLWTPTYVLVCNALAWLVLLRLHRSLDQGASIGTGIVAVLRDYGSNALLAFVLSALLARLLLMVPVDGVSLQQWLYQLLAGEASSPAKSLLYAVLFTASFWPLLAWLRRVRRWSWRV